MLAFVAPVDVFEYAQEARDRVGWARSSPDLTPSTILRPASRVTSTQWRLPWRAGGCLGGSVRERGSTPGEWRSWSDADEGSHASLRFVTGSGKLHLLLHANSERKVRKYDPEEEGSGVVPPHEIIPRSK